MYDSTKTKYKRSSTKYASRKTGSKALVKTKTRPAEKAVKPTKLMSDMVRQIVQRGEEKKVGTISGLVSLCAYNTANPSLASNIIPITPYAVSGIPISQGPGQNQRIGNKIRITSARVRGCLYPTPYGANNDNPCPQNVRVWFFTPKLYNVLPTSLPSFLQGGSGNSTSPQGIILDMLRIVNTDAYTYRGHKDFKVAPATYGSNASGVPAQSWYFSNNDYQWNNFFDIDIAPYLPKVIEYNDADDTPYSKLVCMYWECVDADGSVQNINTTPVQLYYTNTLRYTDA